MDCPRICLAWNPQEEEKLKSEGWRPVPSDGGESTGAEGDRLVALSIRFYLDFLKRRKEADEAVERKAAELLAKGWLEGNGVN